MSPLQLSGRPENHVEDPYETTYRYGVHPLPIAQLFNGGGPNAHENNGITDAVLNDDENEFYFYF